MVKISKTKGIGRIKKQREKLLKKKGKKRKRGRKTCGQRVAARIAHGVSEEV